MVERERKWEMTGQIHRGDTRFSPQKQTENVKARNITITISNHTESTQAKRHEREGQIIPHTTQHQPKITETTQNKTETNVNNTHSDVG